MTRHQLTLFLLLLGINLQAQTIRVPLDQRLEDDKISKSLAILPVYKYVSIHIEPFTLFGVETKDTQPDLVIRKMPDMQGMRDTGYTYLYFSGANTEINQGYCLTLIGNYRRSVRTIYFFIDRNNNLDFTDDGLPDSLTIQQLETEFALKNQVNPSAEHRVRITRIEYGQNIRYKNLLTDHFKKHSGKKQFTDINYCYREQRLNTLGGKYVQGSDSFVIAFKDLNNNGLFNESCVDKFYVGSADATVNTDEMAYVLPQTDDMYFEWNQKRYQLISIDPAGAYIDFKEVKDAVLTKKLEVGKKVPEFSFVNIKNEREEIRDYRKKPTYIFFWNQEKITRKDTMFIRMIFEEYGDEISVITLNHGDVPRDVRIIRYYDGVRWPMAFSSYTIGKLFYLEDLPRGVLLGKRCKLKDDNLSPEELYNQLKNSK
ncbi:MAG: hypothetical protein H6608_01155 [Flavobacteriales bacterium]|nr:hypothetical protein [Bacteroidota bacterium]MCB9239715.1 hypothetical protein [Flavobacteriales bacterium]